MKKNKRWIQLVILSVFVIIGAFTIGKSLFSKEGVPAIGDKVPDFTLQGLEGQSRSLSEFKGKALVINFWGSFCPPCVEETPLLQKYYEEFKDKNIEFIGVNLSEPVVTVQGFMRQFPVSYPIVIDQKQMTERKFGVSYYPTTFFVTPDGKIQDIIVGGITNDNEAILRSKLTALLK